jgi:DNA mismatch repair protein MutS2
MTIFAGMVYPENFEEKIGFDRIRESVRTYCLSRTAGALLDAEGFLADFESIRGRLQRAKECLLAITGGDFTIDPYPDVRNSLDKLAVKGSYLEVQEVADLRKNLLAVKSVLNFFKKAGQKEKFPALTELSSGVKIYPFVQERIDKILSRNDTVRDQASKELARIRTEIASREKQVARRLQSILKTVQAEGLAEADAKLSVRNGRPVIPVPASQKRQLSGIIHDESASGKTVYIEPGEVVGLNNEIRELGYAEHREIIRILTELSRELEPYAEDLIAMTEYLASMDLLQAKAKYARDIGGVMPALAEGPLVDWKKAVHPILFKTLRKEKREVVPLDIRLSPKKRILIISGPNAGGKSVCLKTVGLLQYMVQCGFLVPMDEDSKVGIFERIFIDIGDEQSIDNDLSTYSSHLLSMKYFARNAGESTLLLIDEFGTGTEPALGGAIAEAILDRLNSLSAWGVITTHYSNLKHFAAETEGIENGAMLFDTAKMQPLYRLEIGQPGSSFAFEIARNIGLPEEVIKSASEKVGEDHVEFDRHLRQIIRDKSYWEEKRDRIRVSEKRLQEILGKYATELESAEKTRKEILKKARAEAEELLRQANRQIENTIREIRESQAEKEKSRLAREKLQKFREEALGRTAGAGGKPEEENGKVAGVNGKTGELSGKKSGTTGKGLAASGLTGGTVDQLGKKIEEVREQEKAVRQRRQRFGQAEPARKISGENQDPSIREGDFVIMKGQEVAGVVLERKGNKASVRFGHLVTRVGVDRLEKVSGETYRSGNVEPQSRGNFADWDIGRRKMQFRPEIDVRGQRAEEALRNVSIMIDEAIMVQHRELRILHGKGDGILRQLIRQYLDTVDLVESYGDEHVDLGGAGVTIVILDV